MCSSFVFCLKNQIIMTHRNVLHLINAFTRDEAALRGQPFLAPLAGGTRVRLGVRGLVYQLAIEGARPGWWMCRALDAHRAALVDVAEPWQRGAYLALWPALRVVLVEPLSGDDWIALPFNPSDAAQRFAMRGPLVVRLVEGGQPFERVIGRVEGATIWYDEADRRADPAMAESLRDALAPKLETPLIVGLGPGELAAYAILTQRRVAASVAREAARTEQRLREALMIGGARLVGYELNEGVLRVTWERDSQRSVTLVNPNLDVVSAGICLSGEDERFDLASIVDVVQEAPQFARYGEE